MGALTHCMMHGKIHEMTNRLNKLRGGSHS
jgi:hypothetical protein